MRVDATRNAERMSGFTLTPWDEIGQFYERLTDDGATFVAPMLSLSRSVLAEGAADTLAGHTSMHHLVVTTTPVSAAPDWLWVSVVRHDKVRIDHQTPTGPGDSIERPQSELLPLFWRFSIEKWGIRPTRDLV